MVRWICVAFAVGVPWAVSVYITLHMIGRATHAAGRQKAVLLKAREASVKFGIRIINEQGSQDKRQFSYYKLFHSVGGVLPKYRPHY
jgi:hypothetical protein